MIRCQLVFTLTWFEWWCTECCPNCCPKSPGVAKAVAICCHLLPAADRCLNCCRTVAQTCCHLQPCVDRLFIFRQDLADISSKSHRLHVDYDLGQLKPVTREAATHSLDGGWTSGWPPHCPQIRPYFPLLSIRGRLTAVEHSTVGFRRVSRKRLDS